MAVDLLFLSAGCASSLIAGYRGILFARGRRKPTEIPLIVIAAALGLALIVLAPSVQAVESALVPSLGRLLSNCCTLVAAFGFSYLMLHVSHPPESIPRLARIRLAVLVGALGVLVVAFLVSDPPTGTGIFTGLYRSQPALAVYTLTYSAYLGGAVLDMARLAVGSLRQTRTWLRAGMVLIAIGGALAAGYLAQKVFAVLAELATGAVAEPFCSSAFASIPCTFAVGMPALSVLFLVVGVTVPTLGPRVERGVRAVGRWNSHRRLRPLWTLLHEALPDLATGDTGGDMGERLYGRVIAIRDGLLALQPYRRSGEPPTDPEREAAEVREALRRKRDGEPPSGVDAVPADHDDLAGEIRWLTRVSAAVARQHR